MTRILPKQFWINVYLYRHGTKTTFDHKDQYPLWYATKDEAMKYHDNTSKFSTYVGAYKITLK